MPLTGGQRRYLRGLAHGRRITIWIGRQGLGEVQLQEIDLALDAHELVKVRLSARDRADRDGMLQALCAATRSELVQRVGHVATLYRARSGEPAIVLPQS
jgi:RNA-binding protein